MLDIRAEALTTLCTLTGVHVGVCVSATQAGASCAWSNFSCSLQKRAASSVHCDERLHLVCSCGMRMLLLDNCGLHFVRALASSARSSFQKQCVHRPELFHAWLSRDDNAVAPCRSDRNNMTTVCSPQHRDLCAV